MQSSKRFPLPEADPCPFCGYVELGVASDGRRAEIIVERRLTLSLMDARPMQPGHVLVITKRHAPTLLDLRADEAQEVIEHTLEISKALARTLDADGINAFQNNGLSAGQSVPHYHMHVVPRHTDDGAKFGPARLRVAAPRAELSALATRIRAALPGQSSTS